MGHKYSKLVKRTLICLVYFSLSGLIYSQNKKSALDNKDVPKNKGPVHIIGVGDIMLGTNFPGKEEHLPANDGKDLLTPAKEVLERADLTFGNLESSLSDDAPLEKKC